MRHGGMDYFVFWVESVALATGAEALFGNGGLIGSGVNFAVNRLRTNWTGELVENQYKS